MTAPRQGRKLNVLIVDDNPASTLATYGEDAFMHLEHRFIRSWAEAQQCCASAGDLGGADILLIDVSFDRDKSVEKLGRGSDFLPIGPILALPYIGKRPILSCVTYSFHMTNPKLHEHPYFLVAMGMILARAVDIPSDASALHSSHLSESKDYKQLDVEIRRLASAGFTDTLSALPRGIKEYRESLERALADGTVKLMNRHSLLHALAQMRARIADPAEPLCLDGLSLILVGSSGQDAICLSSLFSDRLNDLGKWASQEILDEIEPWISELKAESPIDWALQVINRQEAVLDDHENDNSDTPLADVKKTILEHLGHDMPSEELTETLRLCVLFANIWAIDHPKPSGEPRRNGVLARLGGPDVNSYFGWFGERQGSKKPAARKRTRANQPAQSVGTFLRLKPLSTGQNRFQRCFLSRDESEITPEDYQAIQIYRASQNEPAWLAPPFCLSASPSGEP